MEKSCGILAYRWKNGKLQVLLGKNGGPFSGTCPWNIPKGHVENGETDKECAVREFIEETGLDVPDRPFIDLGTSKTSKGKVVAIFGIEHDYNPDGDKVKINSIPFTMEYPRKSGKYITAPELCEAKYIDADKVVGDMFQYQRVFVERLVSIAENGG